MGCHKKAKCINLDISSHVCAETNKNRELTDFLSCPPTSSESSAEILYFSLTTSQLLPVVVTLAGSTLLGRWTLISLPVKLIDCTRVPGRNEILLPFPVEVSDRTVPLATTTTLLFPVTVKLNSPSRVIVADCPWPVIDSVGTTAPHPPSTTTTTSPGMDRVNIR
jgi:hypothetical protein